MKLELPAQVKARYPVVPTVFPEGAHTCASSYLHLIVNWLEVEAGRPSLGREAAVEVASKNYVFSGIYRLVLAVWDRLTELYPRHGLTPICSAAEMTWHDLSLAARMDETSSGGTRTRQIAMFCLDTNVIILAMNRMFKRVWICASPFQHGLYTPLFKPLRALLCRANVKDDGQTDIPRMNINVSLPIELAHFIKAEVSAGRYASSSAVVRAALRLMAQVELQDSERLRNLREAWAKGIDSGDAGEIDFTALKREARARVS